MSGNEKIAKIIKGSELFNGLDSQSWAILLAESHYHEYKKNHPLFIQDDKAANCFYIEEGHVKLFRDNVDGEENVLDVLPAGNLVGETSFFNDERYSYSAETATDAVIISMPLKIIRRLIKNNADFCCNMLRHLGNLNLEKEKEIERRTLQEASHRVGCFLLSLCEETTPTQTDIELPYEKVLIAKKLGMRAETFSRGLQKLQKDLGIEASGNKVQIPNVRALSEYTCAACSYSSSCAKSALAG